MGTPRLTAVLAVASVLVAMAQVMARADTLAEEPPEAQEAEPAATPVKARAAKASAVSNSTPAWPSFRNGKGWFLGGSVGISTLSYSFLGDNSQTAGLIELRFGGMFGQRTGLSVEFWSDGHNLESSASAAITENSLAIALTYWVTPRFWLKTGLGSATLKLFNVSPIEDELDGMVIMGNVGLEMVSRSEFSLDIFMRMLASFYESNNFGGVQRTGLALGIGANWY